MKSRAASGLALLLAGALFAVLTVPGGGSDAATDPDKIGTGTNAGNPLTVNVQEIPESDDGSSGVFDLTKYGNLDWFHLTGIPCSNPYFAPTQTTGFTYCDGSDNGKLNRIGGMRQIAKSGATELTWAPLFRSDQPDAEPGSRGTDDADHPRPTAYRGVYESRTSPITYTWTDGDASEPLPVAWSDTGWTDGNPTWGSTAQPAGNHLEGVFYDPDAYPDSSESQGRHNGYKISVAEDTVDRVLRFVGGIWQASATVTVEGRKTDESPVAVPFYPAGLSAGDPVKHALYTVYIPKGWGATVTVQITLVIDAGTDKPGIGHVILGGAALAKSDDSAPLNPVDFVTELARPTALGVEALEPPAVLNLSDPGGSGQPVTGWRHAVIYDDLPENGFVRGRFYKEYTGPTGGSPPGLEVIKQGCVSGYELLSDDGTNRLAGDEEPLPADIAYSGKTVEWTDASVAPGDHYNYAGSLPASGNPTGGAVATTRCSGSSTQGMMKVTVDAGSTDRYLYVLAVGWNARFEAQASFADPSNVDNAYSGWLDAGSVTLFRVFVPVGQQGEVALVTNSDATVAIAGVSIQEVPSEWNKCTFPAGGSSYNWLEFLTDGDAQEGLALAPYFQQFQLRGLINKVVSAGTVTNFQRAQIEAAYCEAQAWTHDDEGEALSFFLHPYQNGYDPENERDENKPFEQEADELKNGKDLRQPMADFTKKAYVCDSNLNLTTEPNEALNTILADCEKKDPKDAIAAGTTVYWVFTLTNVAPTGIITPKSGWVKDVAKINGDPVVYSGEDPRGPGCDLSWTAPPPAVGKEPVFYEDTAPPDAPIYPQHSRACFYSAVIGQ